MLKDVAKVTGRGIILICDDEGFNPGDKITLTVTGVERLTPLKTICGLIVNPNIEKEVK
mgnify:CR=1 FL=1